MYAIHTLLLLWMHTASSSSLGLFPVVDVSLLESTEPACDAALKTLRLGLDTRQLWAHSMVDAGVKSPVGLLSQTLVQFGDFDECLGLDAPVEPQFCLFDISPTQPDNSSWSGFRWGLCVPAACSVSDLRRSLQTYMDREQGWEKVGVDLVPAACTSPASRTSSFDSLDIAFWIVMSAIAILIAAATVWELVERPDEEYTFPPRKISQCLSARQGLYSLLRECDRSLGNIDLSPLNGLHALPFMVIVMAHRFVHGYLFLLLTNFQSVLDAFDNPWTAVWMRVDLFVDVFFFLSAFLLGLLYYAELDKHYVNPIVVYINRLIRIMPAYSVVVFFAATMLPHLGDGPLWNLFVDVESKKCQDHWWANFAFIHNYLGVENLCLIHTWYISCDVQLFFCGTLLVLLLHKSPRLGLAITILLFIVSTIVRFFGAYSNELVLPFLATNNAYWGSEDFSNVFNTVYMEGHYRGTSYIVGLLTGVYVYRCRNEPRLSKVKTYILESLGIALILMVYWSAALFYVPSEPPTLLMISLYAAFNHSIFGFGLALIIVSWTIGYKTLISRLICWKGFIPLSKLSFSTFLFSLLPQYVWIGTARSPLYQNFRELISWTAGDLIFSLMAGLFVYLTVERPLRCLYILWYREPIPGTDPPLIEMEDQWL